MGQCSSTAAAAVAATAGKGRSLDRSGSSSGSGGSSVPLPRSLPGAVEACRGGAVILAGCGGGYDVLGSAPLLHRLRSVASRVILVNLSFTHPKLLEDYGAKVSTGAYRIEPGAFYQGREFSPYFPEALFANAVKLPVHAIVRTSTVGQIVAGYRAILGRKESLRALFLVDGGSDVLFTGDETGLATPAEDMLHLRSALDVPARHKAVVCVGTNVDCGHGVLQSELDERLLCLRANGATLFEHRLDTKDEQTGELSPDALYYADVVDRCDPAQSIVQSMVVASLRGHRGPFVPPHLKSRIARSRAPLTDQTATMFGFDLETVAGEVRYLDRLDAKSDADDATQAIKAHRAETVSTLDADDEGTLWDVESAVAASASAEAPAAAVAGGAASADAAGVATPAPASGGAADPPGADSADLAPSSGAASVILPSAAPEGPEDKTSGVAAGVAAFESPLLQKEEGAITARGQLRHKEGIDTHSPPPPCNRRTWTTRESELSDRLLGRDGGV